MRRMLVSAAIAITAVASFGIQSARAQHTAYECFGFVKSGKSSSCTRTFESQDARTLSNLSTHANFHTLLARGPLTLSWFDARGALVVTFNCAGIGIGTGEGSLDATSANCTQNGEKKSVYAAGTQTLVVTATSVTCPRDLCTFHGQLLLGQSGDLY